MPKSVCVRLSDGLYEMIDPDRPRFRYTFHCAPSDLDDTISVLQAKSWVTSDHIDQLKDLVHQRAGVEL